MSAAPTDNIDELYIVYKDMTPDEVFDCDKETVQNFIKWCEARGIELRQDIGGGDYRTWTPGMNLDGLLGLYRKDAINAYRMDDATGKETNSAD
jgi:hypothetical protein